MLDSRFRLSTLGSIAIVFSLLTATTFAASLPERVVPVGLRAVEVAGGGRILQGSLPQGESPLRALRAGVALSRTYFDESPTVTSIVQSTDGRVTLAQFRGSLARQPISGLIVSVNDEGASPRIAFLFDRTHDVAKSIAAMVSRLNSGAGAGRSSLILRPMRSSDGTVLAALPQGWNPQPFGNGMLVATGPDGAEVDQELPFSIAEPGSSMTSVPGNVVVAYARDPVDVFVPALESAARQHGKVVRVHVESVGAVERGKGMATQDISGTIGTAQGNRRFKAIVLVGQPNGYGTYLMSLKMISAPVDDFKHDAPVMAAIYNSYRVDQQREAKLTADYIQFTKDQSQRAVQAMADVRARNDATFYRSMQHAHAVQNSIDRSTAGFARYIGNQDVVQFGSGGAHETVNSDYAQAVVRADPTNFRIVPMSDYQKNVDF